MLKRIGFQKLNNRGFAITGILYTLFILFLMVLISVLAGLRTRKEMLESSTNVLESRFVGVSSDDDEEIKDYKESFNSSTDEKKALWDGKYVFRLYDSYSAYTSDKSHTEGIVCSVYLHKEDVISSKGNEKLSFIPKDCNNYSYIFSFENSEGENFQGRVMALMEIYSFEED